MRPTRRIVESSNPRAKEATAQESAGAQGSEESRTAAAVCPADPTLWVTNYSYLVNGTYVNPFKTSVTPGSTVRVEFTVAPGCTDREVSLASYEAPSATFDPALVSQQVLFDSDTGFFDEGRHFLEVSVPNCFFQVDFIEGPLIVSGPPLYGSTLTATATGGSSACVAGIPITPPPDEVKTVLVAQPVGAVGVTRQSTAGSSLPRTGTNPLPLTLAGLSLLGTGGILQHLAGRG